MSVSQFLKCVSESKSLEELRKMVDAFIDIESKLKEEKGRHPVVTKKGFYHRASI